MRAALDLRSVAPVLLAVLIAACDGRPDTAFPGDPSLSMSGGSGVSMKVERTITEISPAGETNYSIVNTTVWAPYDENGFALGEADAGLPGPVGVQYRSEFDAPDESWYSRFVDSTGVVHELHVVSESAGPWTRVEYRRDSVLVVEQDVRWTEVNGGWLMDRDEATYHLNGGSSLRISTRRQGTKLARRGGAVPLVASFGHMIGGMFLPRPAAAQFFFRECNHEWLAYGGAVLIAEALWIKFAQTKSPIDLRNAIAATGAAGITLSVLVDCMVEAGSQLER